MKKIHKINLIQELELLASDMVCGTDQLRVYKRIEVLKEAIADNRKYWRLLIRLSSLVVGGLVVTLLLCKFLGLI